MMDIILPVIFTIVPPFKLAVFEAKFLAILCCYLKRYRQTYLDNEEGAGSLDPKINVLSLGLCA